MPAVPSTVPGCGQPGGDGVRLVSRVFDEFREPEVENLGESIRRDHHVLGLQVAMDDSGFVRLGQAVGDLRRDRQHATDRQRPVGNELPQGLALDELHAQERRCVRAADVVHRHDRGMVERRRGPRFLLEASQAITVGRVSGGQDLDRDVATEPRVVRQIDVAHPARAERARIS